MLLNTNGAKTTDCLETGKTLVMAITTGSCSVKILKSSTEYVNEVITSSKNYGPFLFDMDYKIERLSGEVDFSESTNIKAVANASSTINLTATRDAATTDNGNVLSNNTANNYTVTIQAGMPDSFGFALQQASTGTCTLVAGSGVTFIGGTLATSAAGGILSVIATGVANTYNIKAS